jgi:fatty acid desaturase
MQSIDVPVEHRAGSGERGSAYAELSREIKSAGLLERRHGYYAVLIAATLVVCAGGITAFVLIGDSWWQLGTAVVFAVLSTQLGFLGHDAGHRQVFRSGRANYLLGMVLANLGVGFSYGWWMDKHNRHHAHPNDEEKDPDSGAGAFVFTAGQARASSRVAGMFYRYQAWTFFPLLLLEAANLRVASVRYRPPLRECVLLAVHGVAYLGMVFLILSPGKALVFIAVHQGLFGLYLGLSFAPNHKGMPTLTPAQDADYLLRQVLTSRNIRGHWLTDLTLGGLNYQIEHHLFPSMPRGNLRHAQPLVRAFCDAREVSYLETGPIASYAQALGHLDAMGRLAAR